MVKTSSGLLLVVLMLAAAGVVPAPAQGNDAGLRPLVLQVRLEDEAITPVTARFLRRAIEKAESERASCLLIVLDTPGGLFDSTRVIVKTILRSRVPVVVYVAPAGARAASAGVFITLSAHVAAMVPGTHIGAAHPVQLGGLPVPAAPRPEEEGGDSGTQPSKEPGEVKILNDAEAWARTIAELRGRDPEWAARAVRESISSTASEAVQGNVVDLLADDTEDLLRQIHDWEIVLPDGPVRLRTEGSEVRSMEMWWGERLLGTLANPNLAFLLLLFGVYGILFELYTPGWGVAGTLGVICLVLGFFALAVLPVNYVGLALIALALALFVAEAFVTSYGFLSIGGVACMILGGVMLVDSPTGFQRISLWLLIPVATATAAITFLLVGSVVRAHHNMPRTGTEGLLWGDGVAVEAFIPRGNRFSGMVRIHGELWKAVGPTAIADGQEVIIQEREGLTLKVVPAAPSRPPVAETPSAEPQHPT
ncbi:MAG: nodulation protein NfeD [Isosphaeraceae bacterium]